MNDQLITFETAKLAKEKGFDWFCEFYYEIFHEPVTIQKLWNSNKEGFKQPSAPTQSLLQKWIREVHKIFIIIDFFDENRNDYFDVRIKRRTRKDIYIEYPYKSYEEALEVGLQEALKLIK